MLANQSEYACRVTALGRDGAFFVCDKVPPKGEILVAYVEEVGRIEAIAEDPGPGGFAISYALTGPRLERLRQRIQWLVDRKQGKAVDNRRHARYEPEEKISQIILSDGRAYPCEVLDISVSGAGIKTEVVPSLGTQLYLGKMRGRVVRYIENGVAIQFLNQLEATQVPTTKAPLPGGGTPASAEAKGPAPQPRHQWT